MLFDKKSIESYARKRLVRTYQYSLQFSLIIFIASKKNILLHDYMANTKVLYNDENNYKKLFNKLKKRRSKDDE